MPRVKPGEGEKMAPPGEALRELVAKWVFEAEQHRKHGDCYRVGQGWGLAQCADELAALLPAIEGHFRKRGTA
jgi:hypothetical protein